jgi:hypothetical protein
LVEVMEVTRKDHPVIVEGSGEVYGAYEVELRAEVGGRVVWKNPRLTLGGRVEKGEVLLRIDKSDYKLALEQQKAALERARAEVELERGRSRVAQKEWSLFGGQQGDAQNTAASKSLALREPQLRSVELGMQTAENSVEQAKLNVKRTVLTAPFNAVVRSNRTEEGRLVTPQESLATLVDTDTFMAVVSLAVEDLAWLRVPGMNAPQLSPEALEAARTADDPIAAYTALASPARVVQQVGNGQIERLGLAARIIGELDPAGRMAQLLVGIRDPYGDTLEPRPEGVSGLPLLLGAYVNVELEGGVLRNVIELPREALRDGNSVWVFGKDATLQVRKVDIARRGRSNVLVRSGIEAGERVITSNLASPVAGMELRVAEADEPAQPQQPPKQAAQQAPKAAQAQQ